MHGTSTLNRTRYLAIITCNDRKLVNPGAYMRVSGCLGGWVRSCMRGVYPLIYPQSGAQKDLHVSDQTAQKSICERETETDDTNHSAQTPTKQQQHKKKEHTPPIIAACRRCASSWQRHQRRQDGTWDATRGNKKGGKLPWHGARLRQTPRASPPRQLAGTQHASETFNTSKPSPQIVEDRSPDIE